MPYMRSTKKRKRNQVTCNCQAYEFPHRFGGGACDGYHIVIEQAGGELCQHCNLFNGRCEIIDGQESPRECPYVQEFCHYWEVKL